MKRAGETVWQGLFGRDFRVGIGVGVGNTSSMKSVSGNRWLRFVSALCALAIVLVSSAHRFVETEKLDPKLAAYVAAGGSLAGICRSPAQELEFVECPACILAQIVANVASVPAFSGCVEWVVARHCAPDPLITEADAAQTPPARGPPTPLTA